MLDKRLERVRVLLLNASIIQICLEQQEVVVTPKMVNACSSASLTCIPRQQSQVTFLDIALSIDRVGRLLCGTSKIFNSVTQVELRRCGIDRFVHNLLSTPARETTPAHTLLTFKPDRMTRRQLLIICQLVFGAPSVCLRSTFGLLLSLLLGERATLRSRPFLSHRWMRSTITAVVELRPRPS